MFWLRNKAIKFSLHTLNYKVLTKPKKCFDDLDFIFDVPVGLDQSLLNLSVLLSHSGV